MRRRIYNFFKSSFYFDFFIKKLSESFVRNLSIYTAIFFCEKFLIEYLTQVSVSKAIKFSSRLVNLRVFFFETFFANFIVLSFFFSAALFFVYIL